MPTKGIGRGLGRRQFTVERLEQRAMLAGQVTAYEDGGNLFVRGDKSSNQVAIVQINEGAYAVVGFNGTGIKNWDGQVGGNQFKLIYDIDGNIDIDLKQGNDLLAIGNDADSLINKFESLGFGSALGSASTLGSSLNSLLDYYGVLGNTFEVPKDLIIRTREGNDAVAITQADVGQGSDEDDDRIGGRIDADLGDGNNGIDIDPTTVHDDIILRAGKGNDKAFISETDIFQMLDVNLGDGTNVLDVFDCDIGESAVINTGKGQDQVLFDDTDINIDFIVRTNNGHDLVRFTGAEGHNVIGHVADIDTAGGNDTVDIEDVDIGIKAGGTKIGWGLKINAGDGQDGVFVGCEGGISPGVAPAPEFGEGCVNIGDDLLIFMGSGNDGLTSTGGHNSAYYSPAGAFVQNVDIVDNFEVHGDAGHDLLEIEEVRNGHDAFLTGNDGNDGLNLRYFTVGHDLNIDMGSGNDNGFVGYGDIGHNFYLNLGSGNDGTVGDPFEVFDIGVQNDAFLDAGSGNDAVEIEISFVGHNFFANMGSGKDWLRLAGNTVDGKATLDGGSNKPDTLVNGGGNSFGDEEDHNFEVFL